MYTLMFVINYTSCMFLTTIKTFKFTFTWLWLNEKYSCFRHCLLIHLFIYRECLCFYKFYCLLYRCAVSGTNFHQWLSRKSLLHVNMYISIRRLGKVSGSNCLLERGWNNRSSHPEVFLGKGVLKIWSKFTGKHPCRSAICNFATLLKLHFGMSIPL